MLDPDTLATTTRRSLHAVGDLATSFAEVNYGLSPGDAGHPWPYLYVGPWTPPSIGGFWNEPFGASLELRAVPTVDEALTFFGEGHRSV